MTHKFNISQIVTIILFFVFSQLFSYRFFVFSKYTQDSSIILWLSFLAVTILVFIIIILSKSILKFISHEYTFWIFVIIFLILLFFLYPYADGMKINNLGIDQDDCFRIIISNVSNGLLPYEKNLTYLNNPCSTGILEFLIFFPLIFWDNYFIIVPIIALLINFYIIKDISNKYISTLVTYIVFSNLIVLELCVAGSDYIIIGSIYNLSIYSIFKYKKDKYIFWLVLCCFCLIFFYGSRVVFLSIVPLNFLLIFAYIKRKSFIILIPVIFSFLSYLFLFLSHSNYQSIFHLIAKTNHLIQDNLIILVIIIFLLFFSVINLLRSKHNFLNFINNNFIEINLTIFILPLIFFIFTNFSYSQNIQSWEGLNYIVLILPSIGIIISKFIYSKYY